MDGHHAAPGRRTEPRLQADSPSLLCETWDYPSETNPGHTEDTPRPRADSMPLAPATSQVVELLFKLRRQRIDPALGMGESLLKPEANQWCVDLVVEQA